MDKLRLLLLVGLCLVAGPVPAAEAASSVTLDGTVEVLVIDDFENDRSRTLHILRERRTGKRLELQLSPDQAKQIRPGQELRVRGAQGAKVLVVDPGADAITVVTEPASLAPTETTRRVINIIVDINDGSGGTHAVHGECNGSEQIVADDMFGSRGSRNVDGCYRDSSNEALRFGGASYPGTALDVVRVVISEAAPSLAGICPYDTWAAQADAAAIAQGVDLSAYQHRMYVLPMTTTGCWWAGLAYISCGESCQAWVRAYTNHQHSTGPCGLHDTLAHELGHNLGMQHARTDANNDGISDCEYCDTTDIMGYSLGTWRAFNAPRRDHMRWLGADQVVDGASGALLTISALGMKNSPYPQVVKIVPPGGWPYWLSYRAPIGYDVAIFETFHFNKLHVHRADESGYSYLITELADGATHVDENLNLTVRQIAHTPDSATLEVQYGPAFSLSASSLLFGSQLLNVTSSAQTITLLSTGGMALPITSIAIGGASSGQFAQSNNCGTSLTPGASCSIQVTFTPTSIGSKTATLTVSAGGGASTKILSLSGTGVGPAFTLSTNSLAFGNQALNVTSSAKAITLRNTGIAALPITSIHIGGTSAGQFSQTHNCGTSVAVAASCTIRVTFKPTTTGAKAAGLHVITGDAGAQRVSLSGTGVKAAYTLSTSSLTFGVQALNLTSSAKTVILRNTGVTGLPITSIVIGGTHPSQFAQTNNCSTSVAAGASCTIKVTFKPTSTGSKAAGLHVIAGGGASTKSVALSGTGVRSAVTVSPTALSFGSVTRNTSSTAKTVRISNTGTVVLPISSIELAGASPSQFSRTHNCPARVPVGGSCTASVVFRPTSTGAKSAFLRVSPGGGAALKWISLNGTGI